MHWFFLEDVHVGSFTFDTDESKHIARVLRLRVGDRISLTDGKGRLFSGKIIDDNPKRCTVLIDDKVETFSPLPYHLHIAVAPTKNLSRLEWFVEKATEFGISEITLLACNHSERVNFKIDRLERIAVAAIKQSQQTWLPEINQLTSFSDFIKKTPKGDKYIAYVDTSRSIPMLKKVYNPGQHATIMIGPEGDFSKEEIEAAVEAGFVPISLGKNRLRTETAALVASYTINLINQ
jgi:16S rRNA (uracil1498-N3)-methyltransferase